MNIMSDVFATFVGALNTLEWESIAKIIALQVAFAGVGLFPLLFLGASATYVSQCGWYIGSRCMGFVGCT